MMRLLQLALPVLLASRLLAVKAPQQYGAWIDPAFLRYDEGRGQPRRVIGSRKESVSLVAVPSKK